MKNPFILLIVEDQEHHLKDVKEVIEKERERIPITLNVTYATNLQDALSLMSEADGVITDVFFPSLAGENSEGSNGQRIVEECLKLKKPVVWCTSTYHHGRKTDPFSEWGRKRGLEMFDVCLRDEHGYPIKDRQYEDSPCKPWREALYGLLIFCLGIELGTFSIDNIIDGHITFEAIFDMNWNGEQKVHYEGVKYLAIDLFRSKNERDIEEIFREWHHRTRENYVNSGSFQKEQLLKKMLQLGFNPGKFENL